MIKRYSLHITGIVQGVGFRPFVFREAQERGLGGWVINGADGVRIEVEGPTGELEGFVEAIKNDPPPLARIAELSCREIAVRGEEGFSIRASRDDGAHHPVIGPDAGICGACREELFDPSNRRFGHPFISCVDCGPRYTIIEGVPYDREKTSMKDFRQCRTCQAEYERPKDRRFHSQTNCCWKCGPRFSLYDNKGRLLEVRDPAGAVRGFLKDGKIVCIKGLGGFHLACDATEGAVVKELRRRKGRGNKPFALMVESVEQARQLCRVSQKEAELMQSSASPIVLLEKLAGCGVADEVAPRNNYLGLMLPYTGIHCLLMKDSEPLVMTSGNIADEAIIADTEPAFERLGEVADYFLVHDRAIRYRCDDSVGRVIDGQVQLFRRSRGYTPQLIDLGREFPAVLAVGGQMKNTICFLKGSQALLSQHLGDMDNVQAYDFFRETVEHLGGLLSFEAQAVAHDMHPGYQSSEFAKELAPARKIPVQHHKAHVAGCLAEHGAVDKEVIGLSFDGTGFGEDGCVWGGEVFVGRLGELRRAGHFDYLAMPGGEPAVKQPWRMAVAYLKKSFGDDYQALPLDVLRKFHEQLEAVDKLIDGRINSPMTSSCGRLFDAVSSLLGLCHFNTFEGEAAITLEMAMSGGQGEGYEYELRREDDGMYVADFGQTIRGIVEDLAKKQEAGFISGKFHRTVVQVGVEIVERLSEETGITNVVITGGVFQNGFLHRELKRLLAERGFEVYANSMTGPNDGGISLGQAVLAGMLLEREGH